MLFCQAHKRDVAGAAVTTSGVCAPMWPGQVVMVEWSQEEQHVQADQAPKAHPAADKHARQQAGSRPPTVIPGGHDAKPIHWHRARPLLPTSEAAPKQH